MVGHQPDSDFVAYTTQHTPWLRRVAFLLCQDWHETDDLVQTSLTKLYAHWPRVRDLERLDGYLHTVLVDTYLGERRKPWWQRVKLDEQPVDLSVSDVAVTRPRRAALHPRRPTRRLGSGQAGLLAALQGQRATLDNERAEAENRLKALQAAGASPAKPPVPVLLRVPSHRQVRRGIVGASTRAQVESGRGAGGETTAAIGQHDDGIVIGMTMANRSRLLGSLALAGTLAVAVATIPATAAQADTWGQFTLCSDGYYNSYAVFPERNLATTIVDAGSCTTLNLSGNVKELVDLYEDNGTFVGQFAYNDNSGAGVSTTGDSGAPGYYLW
jgi:DNA-directed RNA polymerase specialized sigma24 family protein